MENKKLSLSPKSYEIEAPLKISITEGCLDSLVTNGYDPIDALILLSAQSVLLMRYSIDPKSNKEILYIHTDYGYYRCVNRTQTLLVLSFSRNTFYSQNFALKEGVTLRFKKSLLVSVRVQGKYEIYADISNGRKLMMKQELNAEKAVSEIFKIARGVYDNKRKTVVLEQGKEISDEFDDLLNTARDYAILSNELEQQEVLDLGEIPYLSITPTEYDRLDRVAYRLEVSADMNMDPFKVGNQIEVKRKNGGMERAEIVDVDTEEEQSVYITALFNLQVGIEHFPKAGWFSLSVSTVNMDVQMDAIEKLRTDNAPCKYLDNIIGNATSAGFDDKDLTELKTELSQKKYPPTASQTFAIEKGINSKDMYLVMGPPGTGKTTVILEWVKYFVLKEHKRVLVSSQNNKAVDNVLERIGEEENIDVLRIGSELKIQNNVQPFLFENKIKNLRTSILKTTEGHMTSIDSLAVSWARFRKLIQELKTRLVDCREEKERLDNRVENELLIRFNEMAEIRKEQSKLLQKAHEDKKNKQESEELIASFSNDNFFYALLHYFKKKNAVELIETSIKDFEYCKNKMSENTQKYTQLYQEYHELFNDVMRSDFAPFQTKYAPIQQATEKIIELRPSYDSQTQAFKNSGEFRIMWDNVGDLTAYEEVISEDYRQAMILKDLIKDWQGIVSSEQNYALHEIEMESVDLVGATCIGINSQRKFADLDFDVTIIDEAGQIQIHNALVPMSVSNKVIMLGDHKQIPPNPDEELVKACIENEVDTELLSKSFFEWLYDYIPGANRSMLDTQFRMPHEMADILSEQFYDYEYKSFGGSHKITESPYPNISQRPLVLIDTSKENNRFETRFENEGYQNEKEAEIIKQLLDCLVHKENCDTSEIGVISAYKKQVFHIRDKIEGIVSESQAKEMVASLDSFQGQERDIIIYSFTRSSRIPSHLNRVGFLRELRRLNVAMSRAKKMLILVGDIDYLSGCEANDAEKEFAKFIRRLTLRVKQGFQTDEFGYNENNIGYGEFIEAQDIERRMDVNYGGQ